MQSNAASEDYLKAAYGLTRSEIRLTLRLFSGDSLREAAAKLGIRYESARTQLKLVFQKTNTHRQAQLVLLLAGELRLRRGNGEPPSRRSPRREG